MRRLSSTRLADLWDEIHSSYWLIPAAFTIGAIGLAIGMTYLDMLLPASHSKTWATALQADAARTILSMLAGSMATIVGVVFSITIVALQLASSQFGPHLMRTFLTDRGSQVALGTLLATFTYSMLVIVAVRDNNGLVPYASTYMAILIGMISVAMLIYFISHVTKMMRPETVIASRAKEVLRATRQMFPDQLGEGELAERAQLPSVPACFAGNAREVVSTEAGYIRRIDDAGLMRLAVEHDLLIRLDVRPGDFIVAEANLMAAAPSGRVDDAVAEAMRQTVVLREQRTPDQDVAFARRHLEEVAIRSLSPGINAPYTALPAIHQIGAGLCALAARRLPSPCRKDADGKPRVLVMRMHSLSDMTRTSVGAIASYAGGNPSVFAGLIEVLLLVADRARSDQDRRELRDYATRLTQEAEAGMKFDRDREIVRAALHGHGAAAAARGRIA